MVPCKRWSYWCIAEVLWYCIMHWKGCIMDYVRVEICFLLISLINCRGTSSSYYSNWDFTEILTSYSIIYECTCNGFFFFFFSLFLLKQKEDAAFPIWLTCTFYMLNMFIVGFFFRWWWFLLFRVWHKFVGFSFKTRMKHWINYYLHWEKYSHFISISTRALKEKKFHSLKECVHLRGQHFLQLVIIGKWI